MGYGLWRDMKMDRRALRPLAMQASRRYGARLFLLGFTCGWPVVGATQEAACPKEVAGFRIVCGVSLIGIRRKESPTSDRGRRLSTAARAKVISAVRR